MKNKEVYAYLRIVGAIGPTERSELEEIIDKQLKKQKIGKVSGGGTVINLETKMIYCCDIDIDLLDVRYIDELICIIKDLNLKEKHSLIYDKKEISFN
ncbi:MAG: hypothetical protein IJA34_08040 [Lachnospiraceae bacterium]|nr:hypothetical protein [Lachnospiraceae bacterium]